jgi:hypothetical protein
MCDAFSNISGCCPSQIRKLNNTVMAPALTFDAEHSEASDVKYALMFYESTFHQCNHFVRKKKEA